MKKKLTGFKEHLNAGRGRYSVILVLCFIWWLDFFVSRQLERNQLLETSLKGVLLRLDAASTGALLIVSAGVIMALLRKNHQYLYRWCLAYLGVSVFQVLFNIVGMVLTAGHYNGSGLIALWDVGFVYVQTVLVFMFIYVFLDLSTEGGAFVWPCRDGMDPEPPTLIDYLFISLNVNSTYGPTSEDLVSRTAKLAMSLQVILAIMILTVLIARSVSSIS